MNVFCPELPVTTKSVLANDPSFLAETKTVTLEPIAVTRPKLSMLELHEPLHLLDTEYLAVGSKFDILNSNPLFVLTKGPEMGVLVLGQSN